MRFVNKHARHLSPDRRTNTARAAIVSPIAPGRLGCDVIPRARTYGRYRHLLAGDRTIGRLRTTRRFTNLHLTPYSNNRCHPSSTSDLVAFTLSPDDVQPKLSGKRRHLPNQAIYIAFHTYEDVIEATCPASPSVEKLFFGGTWNVGLYFIHFISFPIPLHLLIAR